MNRTTTKVNLMPDLTFSFGYRELPSVPHSLMNFRMALKGGGKGKDRCEVKDSRFEGPREIMNAECRMDNAALRLCTSAVN
jgi:hypothetical protein